MAAEVAELWLVVCNRQLAQRTSSWCRNDCDAYHKSLNPRKESGHGSSRHPRAVRAIIGIECQFSFFATVRQRRKSSHRELYCYGEDEGVGKHDRDHRRAISQATCGGVVRTRVASVVSALSYQSHQNRTKIRSRWGDELSISNARQTICSTGKLSIRPEIGRRTVSGAASRSSLWLGDVGRRLARTCAGFRVAA